MQPPGRSSRDAKLRAVQGLLDALRNERSETSLDSAALELATIEFPGLDVHSCLDRLDAMANDIGQRVSSRAPATAIINAINDLLYGVLQFRGNSGDYYDPRNSCLNSVLTRRTGIPITLSVVYMEIGRRLGVPIHGVGLPGHFIVVFDNGQERHWVDPFNNGRVLTFADCAALARHNANVDLRTNPAVLAPVTKRQILVRMLSNLKAIYLRGEAFDKARQVLDLLIAAAPEYAEEYRQRGLVHLRLLNHRAAKSDLENYLRLEPSAPEREQVEKQLVLIGRWQAGLN